MSPADPLSELEGYAGELPAAIDSRRLGETLAASTAKLRTADHQIDRTEALLDLAAEIGFGETASQKEMIEELRSAAYDAGEALEAADTAQALDKAVFRYEHDLSRSLSNLDRNLVQHWRLLASRQFEPMISIGNLLSKIDADSDLGASLAACGTAARATPDGLGGRGLLTLVRQLLATRERLQQRRRDELGEGDVATFVNALAEDRATLALLTSTVTEWLTENHALDRLKIRPAT